jgi:hypothetical protein
LRAKDFSYSLEVLYGGFGISKLQFLIKKRKEKISAEFSLHLIHPFLLGPHPDPDSLERLDLDLYPDSINPDPYPDSMNPDPQCCLKLN